MRSEEEIGQVRELIRKVGSFHDEITPLARKSPDSPISKFKIKLVNELVSAANVVLPNRLFDSFEEFDEQLIPTNSDVTTILAQYREALIHYHNESTVKNASFERVYKIDNRVSKIKADWIPAKIK